MLANQQEFTKAIEYVDKNYFSKPYTITANCDRWFNQFAVVVLENDQIVSISGETYLGIKTHDQIITTADIALVRKYHSQHAKLEDPINLEQQAQAKELYEKIVKDGTLFIKINNIERDYKSKIKAEIYKANHGITHSVRTAYTITSLQQFNEKYQANTYKFEKLDLEKLQLMMLFSVVGRRDETGFSDTGKENNTGHTLYQQFRLDSGEAYLKYCQTHAVDLYNNPEDMYHDAIIVELMGYQSIEDVVSCRKVSDMFVKYIMYIKNCDHKTAIDNITINLKNIDSDFNLYKVFKPTLTKANAMLDMMNAAHGLDLTRCYHLYASSNGGSSLIKGLIGDLHTMSFYQNPTIDKLSEFFKLMHYNFDMFKITGNQTLLPLISESDFINTQETLFKGLQNILNPYLELFAKNPQLDPTLLSQLITEAESFYLHNDKHLTNSQPITTPIQYCQEYLQYKAAIAIANHISGRYDFVEMSADIKDNPNKQIPGVMYVTLDNNGDVSYLVLGMAQPATIPKATFGQVVITNFKDLNDQNIKQQILATAKKNKSILSPEHLSYSKKLLNFKNFNAQVEDHHKNATNIVYELSKVNFNVIKNRTPVLKDIISSQDNTQCIFSTAEEAEFFKKFYLNYYPENNNLSIISDNNLYFITIKATDYAQLYADKLLTFERVKLPKFINKEKTLVTDDGRIRSLELIKLHHVAVRVNSTTKLHPNDPNELKEYGYILKGLDRPDEFGRFIKLTQGTNKKQHVDPRTGEETSRTEQDTIDLDLQKPKYQKNNNKNNVNPTVSAKQNAIKNTIFVKKSAHTIPPANGHVIPYPGYLETRDRYFPIGFVFNLNKVDLKGERYIWAQNMQTVKKHWLKSADNHKISQEINTILQNISSNLQWNNPNFKNVINLYDKIFEQLNGMHYLPLKKDLKEFKQAIDKHSQQLQNYTVNQQKNLKSNIANKKNEIKQLEQELKMIDGRLNLYRHDDCPDVLDIKMCEQNINEIKVKLVTANNTLMTLEQSLAQLSLNNPQVLAVQQHITTKIIPRLDLEINRKHKKYAITMDELITQQNKYSELHPGEPGKFNEVLIADTKEALEAIYAPFDRLFYRLNLAYHAKIIKDEYQYDVDLLVFDPYKDPSNYTEARLREDIQEVVASIQQNRFKYEQYQNKDKADLDKDHGLQETLIVDLLNIGGKIVNDFTEIKNLNLTEDMITKIVNKLDLIGSLQRETKIMQAAFADNDREAQIDCFYRAVVLNHPTLVQQIIQQSEFIDQEVLTKAQTFAQKNGNTEIANYLVEHIQRPNLLATMKQYDNNYEKLTLNLLDSKKNLSLIQEKYNNINNNLDINKQNIINMIDKGVDNDFNKILDEIYNNIGKNIPLLSELQTSILQEQKHLQELQTQLATILQDIPDDATSDILKQYFQGLGAKYKQLNESYQEFLSALQSNAASLQQEIPNLIQKLQKNATELKNMSTLKWEERIYCRKFSDLCRIDILKIYAHHWLLNASKDKEKAQQVIDRDETDFKKIQDHNNSWQSKTDFLQSVNMQNIVKFIDDHAPTIWSKKYKNLCKDVKDMVTQCMAQDIVTSEQLLDVEIKITRMLFENKLLGDFEKKHTNITQNYKEQIAKMTKHQQDSKNTQNFKK